MSILQQILLATLATSCLSLLGGFLLVKKKILDQEHMPKLVGFAAGVMLTTAFIDLLPEAIEHIQNYPIYEIVLLGIIVFFFLERFVLSFHDHDDHHSTKPSAFLILVGDAFHNTFDGAAIAAAFLTDPALGIVTTIAIAAHEIPHEIADFTILVHGGMKKTRALYFNFLSALTAFIGALGGYFFLSLFEEIQPLFLGFSAGMFIYIACSNLIPDMNLEFKKEKAWIQTWPFVIGLLVSYYLITTLQH